MSNGGSVAFVACIALDITIQFLSVSTHSIMSRGAIQVKESIGLRPKEWLQHKEQGATKQEHIELVQILVISHVPL